MQLLRDGGEGENVRAEPAIGPVPENVRGFLIRVDLLHTKPPVWRRFEIAGDITLDRLHDVLQTVMGWTDSHLHSFRTGTGPAAAAFATEFDRSEAEEGPFEDGVRLDQVIAEAGDRLWYDYDFGDSWTHVLRVEEVNDEPPPVPVCTAGWLACPPEDCGGVGGYFELAEWVRSDFSDDLRPEVFDDVEDGLMWLPESWHPDVFDLTETNELLTATVAEPVPVPAELASLIEQAKTHGSKSLRTVLALPASHGSTELSDSEATELTAPYRILLDILGDGAPLTGAGYLKPALVEQIARRTGIADWWIGKANREDLTPPVANLRATAKALGLVAVRKGHLTPTKSARVLARDSQRLLHHIVDRLPLGRTDADRHAGWVSLAVIGSETPAHARRKRISELMFDLGWRDGRDGIGLPPAWNPTLDVLRVLSGEPYTRQSGHRSAVSAAARSALRP